MVRGAIIEWIEDGVDDVVESVELSAVEPVDRMFADSLEVDRCRRRDRF